MKFLAKKQNALYFIGVEKLLSLAADSMNIDSDHHSPHLPSSPNYISDDSEDPYGESETDELHPSSDSELVSHPSDNEDILFNQLHDSDDSDNDADDNDSHGVAGERDGFQFVARSDLDSLSRPRSRLSHYSNNDSNDDAMKLVYPSMTLSQEFDRDRRISLPPSLPASLSSTENFKNDDHETVASSLSAPTEDRQIEATVRGINDYEMKSPDSHDPSAHDIPVTLDSSQETISDHRQPKQQRQQLLSSEPYSNSNPQEQCNAESDEREEQRHDSTDKEDSNDSKGVSNNTCIQDDISDGAPDTYLLLHQNSSSVAQSLSDLMVATIALPSSALHADYEQMLVSCSQDHDPLETSSVSLDNAETNVHDYASIEDHINYYPLSPKKSSSQASIPDASTLSEHSFIRTFVKFVKVTGLLSLAIIGGFLALEYYNWLLQPAHVVLSSAGVTYADDHRLAVVNLDIYSSRLRQERHLRSPTFHIRVLNNNNPWTLQDAPAQPLYLFAEPFIVCPDSGTCHVYIASLQKRHKKNTSPWLCHDTGYYVHIWFANGTRVPLSPPEIFTTRGSSDRKPLACMSPVAFTSSHTDSDSSQQEASSEDDYLAYWKERWRQISETISNQLSNNSQMVVYWDPLQPIIVHAKAMAHAISIYYHHTVSMVLHSLSKLNNQLLNSDTRFNTPPATLLDRARINAKNIQAKMVIKLQGLGEHIPNIFSKKESARRKDEALLEEQIRTLRKTFEDQLDSITVDKALRIADEVLTMAETGFEALLDTEVVKDLAKTVHADEIKRATERVVLKTEEQLDAILHSELARQVNRDLQRLMDDFRTTPTGGKIAQEIHDIQSDAKRYIRSLQRKFRLIRLNR
ncbi:hypothetical protein FBU30_003487 [Linnemannia zychae]|nr:hypothetical protein FBU30_003487 [Linnemannia zychae]